MNQPCPICHQTGGFHTPAPHLAARDQIPRDLIFVGPSAEVINWLKQKENQ